MDVDTDTSLKPVITISDDLLSVKPVTIILDDKAVKPAEINEVALISNDDLNNSVCTCFGLLSLTYRLLEFFTYYLRTNASFYLPVFWVV